VRFKAKDTSPRLRIIAGKRIICKTGLMALFTIRSKRPAIKRLIQKAGWV